MAYSRRSRMTNRCSSNSTGAVPPIRRSGAAKLLARHRHLETLFRGDQVIVIILLQINLDPVHFAAELIVFWVIVGCNGRTGSLADIAGLVCREYHRYRCIYAAFTDFRSIEVQ